MLTSDQRAPARLGHDTRKRVPAPETADSPSLDQIIEARISGHVGGILNARTDQIVDAVIRKLSDDPYAIYRHRKELYSPDEIAGIVGVDVETVREWTRRDASDPRHLPRVNDNPIRILPSEFATWLENNNR